MPEKLHWNTVSKALAEVLRALMRIPELENFRLIGGTGLSLRLGHRKSFDIDLFTDQEFGSVDFNLIRLALERNFNRIDRDEGMDLKLGITRRLGVSDDELIKVDLYYADNFIRKEHLIGGVRIADIEDIAAMKLEVISHSGRKKDFWDVHELLDIHSIANLIQLYKEKYPYGSAEAVLKGLINFHEADEQFDPVCLRGKYWELIKIDLQETVESYRATAL